MDLAYFEQSVPVTNDIVSILLAIGWALLLGNLVFQSMRSMAAGLGFEGEDPKILFSRTFVFSFLLLVSHQICDIGLGITATVIELLQVPSSVQIPIPDETIFPIGASWLLVLIIGFVVMWQVIRLFFETGERYVVTAVLTILSPLAFSMGGSKSTEDIFKGWVRMFASMCLMMVFNVIFLKMLISVLAVMPDGVDVLPWMILVMGIARVARKIDSIIARIGLNPAITGDGLGRSGLPGMMVLTIARSIGGTVLKTVGRNGGPPGGTGGGGKHTPPGGSGGGGAGSRARPFGGGSTRTGRTSSTAYASSSQQRQTASSAGTSAAQRNAVQATRTQSDKQSVQHTSSSSHSTGQSPFGGAARAHPPSETPDSFGMAGIPGKQQDGSRRTSVRQERGSWSQLPSSVPKRTSPALPGMAGTSDAAGKQAVPGTSQPGTTRFSTASPTVRQEAPAGRPGGAASAASRQGEVNNSRADVSTRQTSMSTQQATAENDACGSTSSFPVQSHAQSGKAAVSSGIAGISDNRRAARPASGGKVPSSADSTKAASSSGVSYLEARAARGTAWTSPLDTPPFRPGPAQQENRPRSSTGISHRASGPSSGMAGTAHAAKKVERPTEGGQTATSPAASRRSTKSMPKATAPGGVPPSHQKNRPSRQKRGDEDHGT